MKAIKMTNFLKTYDREYVPKLGVRAAGFRVMFELLEPKKMPLIVETGCLRQKDNWEGDGQSTFLFNEYIKQAFGDLVSIDIDPKALEVAFDVVGRAAREHQLFHCGDSVLYLTTFAQRDDTIDLLYLDSFDLDASNPMPAAQHHLMELCSAMGALRSGSIVAVDDNIVIDNALHNIQGKGMLIHEYMKKLGVKPVYEGYQMIWVLP